MSNYLNKHALYPAWITPPPQPNLGLIVVIPSYDEPQLLASLEALHQCVQPSVAVEVIVVINHSEADEDAVKIRNQQSYQAAQQWAATHRTPQLDFHILYCPDLPKKHAGVGLARKIGLDEAVRRFEAINHPSGILACFDADAHCATNYLTALVEHFNSHPQSPGCSIHFEHPLDGDAYSPAVYAAILHYELHLRYYIEALRFAKHPHAYQTIGSSMAVRADIYQQQGGMNRRKAGEDFYFLHKFIALGNFTELNTTTVFPSPRISHRVPFGTGRAVGDILHHQQVDYLSYHPHIFRDLRQFFEQLAPLYQQQTVDLPTSLQAFLHQHPFEEKLAEIRQHTTSYATFYPRFFRWFNAFLTMKFIHFARDNYYPSISVVDTATWLLRERGTITADTTLTPRELLERFRH